MTRKQQTEEAAHDWLVEKYGSDDTEKCLESIKGDFMDGTRWAATICNGTNILKTSR